MPSISTEVYSEELRNDKEIILEAIRYDNNAFQYD